MDEEAIRSADEKDLVELGLKERGHIIALKSFCMLPLKEKAKNELKGFIKMSGKERIPRSSKTIRFGWKHFNSSKNRYCNAREGKGGGTIKKVFSDAATSNEIKTELISYFFPDGKNLLAGNIESLNNFLGNNQGINIEHLESKPFTVHDFYIRIGNHSNYRLYLMTKKKNFIQLLNDVTDVNSSDDDFDLPPYPKFRRDENDSTTSFSEVENSTLLGSTDERTLLRDETDAAYQHSLEIDSEKAIQKSFSTSDLSILNSEYEDERLSNLMKERESRVQLEATVFDAHVTVTVQHPLLGPMICLFSESAVFQHVYDWVGSLAIRPEHFELRTYKNEMISPIAQVYSGVINVHEVETAVLVPDFGTAVGHVQDETPATSLKDVNKSLQLIV